MASLAARGSGYMGSSAHTSRCGSQAMVPYQTQYDPPYLQIQAGYGQSGRRRPRSPAASTISAESGSSGLSMSSQRKVAESPPSSFGGFSDSGRVSGMPGADFFTSDTSRKKSKPQAKLAAQRDDSVSRGRRRYHRDGRDYQSLGLYNRDEDHEDEESLSPADSISEFSVKSKGGWAGGATAPSFPPPPQQQQQPRRDGYGRDVQPYWCEVNGKMLRDVRPDWA